MSHDTGFGFTDAEEGFDLLENIEGFLAEEGLSFDQNINGDLSFEIAGPFRTFELFFSFRPEGEAVQLSCRLGFDLSQFAETSAHLSQLDELIGLINQKVWFGHFETEISPASDAQNSPRIMFRLTLPLSLTDSESYGLYAHMIHCVTEAVERFVPAFEFWLKGMATPKAAIEACLFETHGEA